MSVFFHQWPADALIELFDRLLGLFGDMSQDGVNHL